MPDSRKPETLRFLYTFQFPDNTEKQFEIRLNAKTLELVNKKDLPKPSTSIARWR